MAKPKPKPREMLIRVKVITPAGAVTMRKEIDHNSGEDREWLATLCREQFEAGNAVLTGPATHSAFA